MKGSYSEKALFRIFKENILYSIALIAVVIAVVVFSLVPPQILKIIIDKCLMNKSISGFLALSFLYLLSFMIIGALDFVKGLLLTVLGQKLVKNIRLDMAYKAAKLKSSYFTENAAGTITSRFINDVENINSLFSDGVISMAIDCFKIVGIIISIWIFSTRLGIFALCLVPIIFALTRFFRKRMFISQQDNLKELAKVNNHISESIKNMIMIKSFSREKYMEDNYRGYLGENYRTMNKVNFYDACYSPIIQVMTAAAVSVILYISMDGGAALGISIGMIAASVNLITSMFAPIDNLGTELQNIQTGLSGIESINEFFNQEEDEKKNICVDIEKMKKEGLSLKFDGMSFSYDGVEKVLSNICLSVASHENLCFVGRTGVGKTTLFKLIVGILKPTSGRVLINGIDVYDIADSEKRKIFGYVEQDFSFLKGDIAYQITLGDESVTEEQVEEVMKFVGLNDYVKGLKNGYRTEADGGSMFSKGQKQLMSIARAIVKNPPVLLLDEVTSNLDSVTEDKVVEVLKRACSDKMILSISHRMSSVVNSDRVVLIENGVIRACGSPDEIIKSTGWIRENNNIANNMTSSNVLC